MHVARTPRAAVSAPAVRRLALVAAVLAFGVVVLGSYVRLTDAGLGCPDWPGCYGRLAPGENALEAGKAWREMIHRYAAGTLGLLVGAVGVRAWLRRSEPGSPRLVPALLVGVVVFQSLLGMWTVTLLLEPVVVMGHLLGGLTTLLLLTWLAAGPRPAPLPGDRRLRVLGGIGLAALAVQIALGGWTSANYAATACPDLPACRVEVWPEASFTGGFVSRPDVPAADLPLPAKTAIHLAHRVGAAVAVVAVGTFGVALLRAGSPGRRRRGGLLLGAVAVQATLGLLLVATGFPLALGVAHNAGAALLAVAATVALHGLGVQKPGKRRRRSSRSTGPVTETPAGVVSGSSRP